MSCRSICTLFSLEWELLKLAGVRNDLTKLCFVNINEAAMGRMTCKMLRVEAESLVPNLFFIVFMGYTLLY